MSSLAKRILTVVLLIPPILGALYLGPHGAAVILGLAAIFGAVELARLFRSQGLVTKTIPLAIGALLLLASFGGYIPVSVSTAIVYLLALAMVAHLFTRGGKLLLEPPAIIFGSIYLGLLPAHLLGFYRLGLNPGNDPRPVYLLLILVWSADTAAYLVGSSIGRHKFWPRISPAKSWEGAIAGLLAPIACAIGFGGWFLGCSIGERVVAGILVGVFAQLGDLCESLMKREASIKDSGRAFPGHGGVLDRIDSLVLVIPILYTWLRFAARTS